MKKTAVLVGRFQTDELHLGYQQTIDAIFDNGYDDVLIIIGESVTRGTDTDPLPYFVRQAIVAMEIGDQCRDAYISFNIAKLTDVPNDDFIWSRNLDLILEINDIGDFDFIVGRDSFQKYYQGKHDNKFKVLVDTIDDHSSSRRRAEIGSDKYLNFSDRKEAKFFARGAIFASQYMYPTVYPTIDIVLFSMHGTSILLGKKANEQFWRLPGGFADPNDACFDQTAARELYEETGVQLANLLGENLIYRFSQQVDDNRYRKTKHKIITTVFSGNMNDNIFYPVAGDDLEHVEWFGITDLDDIVIYAPHKEIINRVITGS